MSCESIRPLLPMLLYGELSFDEEEAVDTHLDTCTDCRKALQRERELLAVISEVAVEPSAALLHQSRVTLFDRLQQESEAVAALPVP
jgi:predicted anti-sigma-YlaC factor YlaD